MSGIFNVQGSIPEKTKNHVAYIFQGSGIGSTVKILLSLDLSEKKGSTDIKWHSQTELSGLVGGVSEPVLRKVSEEKINQIVAAVKSSIEKAQRKK